VSLGVHYIAFYTKTGLPQPDSRITAPNNSRFFLGNAVGTLKGSLGKLTVLVMALETVL
jgi:hypothetical protein